MSDFSNHDKLDCAKREVSKRKHVYTRLVSEGKLSQSKATREIRCMEAIVEDYENLAKADRLI